MILQHSLNLHELLSDQMIHKNTLHAMKDTIENIL